MADVVDILESTQISEMAAGAHTLVPLSEAEIKQVAGDDPDPKFATYIIEGGWSGNKRYYGPTVLDSISEQINRGNGDFVGYQGHIPPEQEGYAFPDIQFRWVKAKIQAGGEKAKLLVKAYLLPGTKAREYAERGLKIPISIAGRCDQRPIRGGVEVSNFDLESIDMARPGKAGMGGRLATVTNEMEGGKQVDGKDIAALNLDELKQHNPLLVEKIEADAKKPLSDRISEMEKNSEGAEDNAESISRIRKALGISEDADVLEVIGKTLDELKAQSVKVRQGILDGILDKRFKDEKDRKLVGRILATEMENAELPEGDDDAAKMKITEMVNKAIDEDEDLKGLASEMEGSGANVNGGGGSTEKSRQGKDEKNRELKPGYENDRIKVRAAR